MKNFVSNGCSKQLIAPAGGVLGGQVYAVKGIVGVVVADAAEGDQFTLKLEGEYSDLAKKTGEAWALGDKLYYEIATSSLTTTVGTAPVNYFAGYAAVAALSADVTGSLLLV